MELKTAHLPYAQGLVMAKVLLQKKETKEQGARDKATAQSVHQLVTTLLHQALCVPPTAPHHHLQLLHHTALSPQHHAHHHHFRTHDHD